MYTRDFSFTKTAACALTFETGILTITTPDSSVEGSDAFTFAFTTTTVADLIVIQVPSKPYYDLTT